MAGSNQAMNLTGMLSQIGGTLGSEIAGQDLMVRNIQNAGRPNVDPTDPVGMMRLADWQNKMGRTQESTSSIGMLQEKRLADVQAATDMENSLLDQFATQYAQTQSEYQQAIDSGDPTLIEPARAKLTQVEGMAKGAKQQKLVKDSQANNRELGKLGRETVQSHTVNEVLSLQQQMEDAPPPQRVAMQQRVNALMNQPGVRDAVLDTKGKMVGNEAAQLGLAEKQGQAGAIDSIATTYRDAGGGEEGRKAVQEAIDNDPVMAVHGKEALARLDEMAARQEKWDVEAADSDMVKEMDTSLTTQLESMLKSDKISLAQKKAFENRIKTAKAGPMHLQAQRLKDMMKELDDREWGLWRDEKSEDARVNAEMRATQRSVDLAGVDSTYLEAAAEMLKRPGVLGRWYNAATGGPESLGEDASRALEIRLARDLARRRVPGMEGNTEFMYDADGNVKISKGEMEKNPDYDPSMWSTPTPQEKAPGVDANGANWVVGQVYTDSETGESATFMGYDDNGNPIFR